MVDSAIISDHIAMGFKGGPTFATDKLVMMGGQERRFQNRSVAIHQYTWEYSNQTRDLIDELRAFFMDRRGDFKVWLLKDWADFSATNTPVGLGTGALSAYQLIKSYTAGFNPYERAIRHVKTGTLQVYKDGVLQTLTSHYTIDTAGLITFTSAPANGVVITASYEFYVPVRFDGDAFMAIVNYPEAIDAMTVTSLNAVEVIP